MLTRSRRVVRCAAGSVALLAALGCGDSGPTTYPVRGKVVYKGPGDVTKLAGGHVHLESVGEPRVTASGEIGPDGTFSAWCYLQGKDVEGVPAGEYRACVRPPADGGGTRGGGAVAPRYQRFDTSGLKVTVAAGANAPTLEIEAGR